MKTTKRLSLLLTIALLIGILCGCGNKGSNSNGENIDSRPPNLSSTKKIQMSEIRYASTFSEDYAFVTLNENADIYCCINKSGEILFQLENMKEVRGFHNGYSFVTDKSNITYLCTTKGELISAEDFGCTDFIVKWSEDYIFVIKTISDHSGSTDYLGILSYDLEFIIEPSVELHKKFFKYYNKNFTNYFSGYLYNYDEETCLNLLTGVESNNLSAMYKNAQVTHPSDLWEYLEYPRNWTDGATYIDNKTGKTAVDLREYKETIKRAYEFEDGTASLLFQSDSSTGRRYYFGVIDETGSFQFEPLELPNIESGEYFVTKDGNYYLLQSSAMAYKTEYTVVLINSNGVSKQFNIPSSQYLKVSLCDGVILVEDMDEDYNSTYTYYTLEMNPLF